MWWEVQTNGVPALGGAGEQKKSLDFLLASLMQRHSASLHQHQSFPKNPFELPPLTPLRRIKSPREKGRSLPGLRLLDNTLNSFQGESRNPCSLKPAQATRKCILLGLHTEHPAHQLLGGVSHRHRHGCRTRQRRTRGLVAHCSHAHRMPSIHLPQKTC